MHVKPELRALLNYRIHAVQTYPSNDIKYVENKSLSLDLRIFASSILIPILGKKALNDRIS